MGVDIPLDGEDGGGGGEQRLAGVGGDLASLGSEGGVEGEKEREEESPQNRREGAGHRWCGGASWVGALLLVRLPPLGGGRKQERVDYPCTRYTHYFLTSPPLK